MVDRRFDAWLAGASEAQVEAWNRGKKPADVGDQVTDDQLPPALRGGALEVF